MSGPDDLGGLPALYLVLGATLFKVLPRTDSDEEWNPVQEAENRLRALDLVEATVRGFGPNLGSDQEVEATAATLKLLRARFTDILDGAREAATILEGTGIRLDPAAPGGGTFHSGGRGHPPSLLSRFVRDLLRQRFAEWNGEPPFPGRNTQELREWLRGELGGEFSAFPHEEIDPRPKGPLYRIVSNLQRLQ